MVGIFGSKEAAVHTDFPNVKIPPVEKAFRSGSGRATPRHACRRKRGGADVHQPFLAMETAGNKLSALLMLMPSPPLDPTATPATATAA